MSSAPYTQPVAALFDLPEPDMFDDEAPWLDYATLTAIRAADVPALVRLATDTRLIDPNATEPAHRLRPGAPLDAEGQPIPTPLDNTTAWTGPMHAWRVLAQLGSEEAIAPLVDFVKTGVQIQGEWAPEELAKAIARFGARALPALGQAIGQPGQEEVAYSLWVDCLLQLAERTPETRPDVIALAGAALKRFAEFSPNANASFVWLLVKLRATESAPLIEAAFAADAVDQGAIGNWHDAQVALGQAKPEFGKGLEDHWDHDPLQLATPQAPPPAAARPSSAQADAKKKAKRKLANASRQKNRKR